MSSALEFDYYYGIEAEQFSFYRIPRLLIKDDRFKGLSSDAKLLYGLMLDRMALSMKNGWFDEKNRTYIIYAVENIMEDLGCSKPTCTKVMRELETETGIGLIEKKRRGLGKPDLIYVKNFAAMPVKMSAGTERSEGKGIDFQKEKIFTSGNPEAENQKEKEFNLQEENYSICASQEAEIQGEKESGFQKEKILTSRSKEILLQEVKDFNFQKKKNFTSGSKEIELPEVKEIAPNYNNISYTDLSYTNHINQSGETAENIAGQKDMIDMIGEANIYMEIIRKNLEYDHYMKCADSNDRELFEEIYETICDVVCVRRSTIRINGDEYPYQLVRSRFLKLNSAHVDYVMGCMKENTTKITNIRSYLITALYNAPSTMSHYFQQEVQYDMYGGGWEEKGVRQQAFGHAGQR